MCKNKIYILLVLVMGAWLGACAQPVEAAKPQIAPYEVPLKSRVRSSLYFVDINNSTDTDTAYTTEIRELDVEGTSVEEAAVAALLEGPTSSIVADAGMDSLVLNSVYIVQNIAFIDMSAPIGYNDTQLEDFRTAAGKTLSQIRTVEYVYLTLDGMLPAVFAEQVVEVVSASELAANENYFLLYYPDRSGSYAVPVVSKLAVKTEVLQSMANQGKEAQSAVDTSQEAEVTVAETKQQAIFDALNKSSSVAGLSEVYAKDVELQNYQANDDGSIAVELRGQIDASHEAFDIKHACLALSLMAAEPAKDTVNLTYGIRSGSQAERFTHSYTQAALMHKRGGFISVFFKDKEGESLIRVQRARPFDTVRDPFACVNETFIGPQEGENSEAVAVVPEGTTAEDYLGSTIDLDLAVLDMSTSFYEACAELDENSELCLAYSLANALTENGAIKQVLFVREGANVETLSGRIVLSQPLLSNPGLARQQ